MNNIFNKIQYIIIIALLLMSWLNPHILWFFLGVIMLINKEILKHKKETSIIITLSLAVLFIPLLFKVYYLLSITIVCLLIYFKSIKNFNILFLPLFFIHPNVSYIEKNYSPISIQYDYYGNLISKDNEINIHQLNNLIKDLDFRYLTIIIPKNKEELIDYIIQNKYTILKDYAYLESLKSERKCFLLLAGAMNGWKEYEDKFQKDNDCRKKQENKTKILNIEALFSK